MFAYWQLIVACFDDLDVHVLKGITLAIIEYRKLAVQYSKPEAKSAATRR